MRSRHQALVALAFVLAALVAAAGQAGRRAAPSKDRGRLLNVYAARADGSAVPVSAKDVAFYDNGIEQQILGFTPDPGPARLVLLVDNSLSLRADVPKLAQMAREFVYEIYEGDQLLVVGYDEQAEIVSDWTDKPEQMEASLGGLRKKGQPYLFDALTAVIEDALVPLAGAHRKRAVVLIGDGLDRGSKTKFKDALAALQSADVVVYALQIPDRTGGAYRRDTPKPSAVVRRLAEETGGRVLSLEDPRAAAKSICDELRKHRYLLAYNPSSISYYDTRRLLVVGNEGVTVRAKVAEPPR
ncbi:MAG: VWA domain-containing protein [Pyrinomonadaceae bacterium]